MRQIVNKIGAAEQTYSSHSSEVERHHHQNKELKRLFVILERYSCRQSYLAAD